jgi:hypothetical protein
VPFAESAVESAVLKGMVKVIMDIVFPGIVPNPLVAARVDVWGLRVALLVTIGASLLGSGARLLLRSGTSHRGSMLSGSGSRMRRGAVRRNMSAADSAYTASTFCATILRRRGYYN